MMNAPILPGWNAPNGLWSLWDMQNLKVGEIIRLLQSILNDGRWGQKDSDSLDPGVRKSLLNAFLELLPHCESIGLSVPTEYLRRGLTILQAAPGRLEVGTFARLTNMIADTIEIEFRARKFFILRPDLAALYDAEIELGDQRDGRFSEASSELMEAAKCLALQRNTASVFHSIRCLEQGIRALSRCLGIPDPMRAADRNWGAMLKTLKNAVDTRWPNSSTRQNGDGEFFDNAYAALAAMQNPWRNATMHLDHKYSEEDAIHISEIVRGFMKKLASRMDEDGTPLA